jgi:hypothetical protein
VNALGFLLLAKEDLEWRFESAPQPLFLFLIGLGVIAFVVTAYLLEPKGEGQSRAGRIFLGVLRAAALLLAVGILFRPVERKETRETKDGYVVIAIDKSRSMSLKDREGDEGWRKKLADELHINANDLKDMDRLARVKRALSNDEKHFLERLAEKNKVKLYTFDATRNRLADIAKIEHETAPTKKDPNGAEVPSEATLARALSEIQSIEADGAATALGDSLQKILTDLRSEKVAALVLLTDGRSNAGSLAAEQVAIRYGKKGIPIYAIGVGDPNPPKDLSVENLEAPDVSIAGDIVNFMSVIKAQGYDTPRNFDVELVWDGNVVKREQVLLGGDRTEVSKQIRYKPEKEGEFNVEVRIVPDEAEITTENNKAVHHIRIVAQKIKVLYVEGYPRWEYRYLKNALIRDAKIDAQCLLLSADPGFPQESSRGVPSLRSFPTREELFQYHVIIFGDVNPQAKGADGRPVFPEGAFDAVKEFVADQGGGLLMISGEQDNPRRYAQTPLGSLLPIVVEETEGAPREWNEAWHPRLTREGSRSELLRLETDEDRNKALWEGPSALPGFYWYSRTLKAKPLARVLAEHPNDRNQNGGYPIWAWQYFKSGTVFWSATDETWRWRAGVGDRYMYKFWGQVLRFLSHGRFQRSKRFVVMTDKTKYTVGEETRIHARVLDRSLHAATEKTQEVVVERPDAQQDKVELKLIEGQPGNYEGRYRAVKMGVYKVSIDPGTGGSDGDVVPKLFEVKFPSIELEEPRMDQEGLAAVARASGGEFMKLDKLSELPERIMPMTETVAATANERELWDTNLILAIFAGILIVEWIGRKVARLL